MIATALHALLLLGLARIGDPADGGARRLAPVTLLRTLPITAAPAATAAVAVPSPTQSVAVALPTQSVAMALPTQSVAVATPTQRVALTAPARVPAMSGAPPAPSEQLRPASPRRVADRSLPAAARPTPATGQAMVDAPMSAADPAPAVEPTTAAVADVMRDGPTTVAPAARPEADAPAGPSLAVAASSTVPIEQPASPAGIDDADVPVYKTRIPPALTLDYELRRGMLAGSGSFTWHPDGGGRYELRLEGRVAGLKLLTQVSQGGFDSAGLAPRRYTDQRLNRAPLAANFQRDKRTITFSGPSTVYPLLAGTQDRLSWMVQLAAVVSAEPGRLAAGSKVVLYVVGARGEADLWAFRSSGAETIDTPAGRVQTVRFLREPQGEHDTRAEVWLDPARHGLPVRAVLGGDGNGGGDAFELSLRELKPF